MNESDLKSLCFAIQKVYEHKKLDEVLGYYHPQIILIGPSMTKPVKGIDDLKAYLHIEFNKPQRSAVKLSDFAIGEISRGVFSVLCRIEGRQSIYYSTYSFKGWLSRVFVEADGSPKIIFEHLTLEP